MSAKVYNLQKEWVRRNLGEGSVARMCPETMTEGQKTAHREKIKRQLAELGREAIEVHGSEQWRILMTAEKREAYWK